MAGKQQNPRPDDDLDFDDDDVGGERYELDPFSEEKPTKRATEGGFERAELPSDIEVEVVDDTPEEDRGITARRTPAQDEEDEVDSVNDAVQRRINALKHSAHDERRAKEAAQRERDEAMQFARAAFEQLQSSKQKFNAENVEQLKKSKEKAEARRKEIRESIAGAGEKQMEWKELARLQDELADTVADIREYDRQLKEAEIQASQKEDFGVQTRHTPNTSVARPPQQAEQQPALAENVQKWIAKNTWFNTDRSMQALALAVSDELFSNGITHVTDPDTYFKTIDREVRRRFPEKFQVQQPRDTKGKYSPVSRPAQSPGKAKMKVQLSKTELATAKRLGVPPEEYARHKLLLQKGE